MPTQGIGLILAGGDGLRLWDLTREITGAPIPKQYCRLWNDSSLLEATIARVRFFAPLNHINVVINHDHLRLANEQLHLIPETNIFVQPLNRDTGPGIIFGLLQLARHVHSDAIIAAFPSDHYVSDDRTFIDYVSRAAGIVYDEPEKIVVLGIAPDRSESGYGYLLPAGALGKSGLMSRAFQVEAFCEKPDPATASILIARGGLWNTFVMVFRLSRMIELMRELAPTESQKLFELDNDPMKAAELYHSLAPWNFSTQVLARIPRHLTVLKVDGVSWSDWGTREAVEHTYRSLNLKPSWLIANPTSRPLAVKKLNASA